MPKKNKDSEYEYIVCEACHHVNIVKNKQFERRDESPHSFRLDKPTFEALDHYGAGKGGNWNNKIANLCYDAEQKKLRDAQLLLRQKEVKSFDARSVQSEE